MSNFIKNFGAILMVVTITTCTAANPNLELSFEVLLKIECDNVCLLVGLITN